MKKKIRNIFNLTKVLVKNSFQNPYIFDKKTNRINKKSPFIWLFFILIIVISYLTYSLMDILKDIGQETIFLNLFPIILMTLLAFQVALASTNVYYYSKDFELILPLPIKAEEMLIARFNTIIINLYFSEFIFVFFPLIIYGIMTSANIVFYMFALIFLLIFPILPALIVSIIMMLFMKLSRFIKNKDIFQIIITLVFIILVFILEILISNKIINSNFGESEQGTVELINNFYTRVENINKYFLVINPSIKMLQFSNVRSILELIKIIVINIVFLILFILFGKRMYLKDILKNNNYYLKRSDKNIKYEKDCKKTKKGKAYIKNEFKNLIKNPAYFMQCIFPIFILFISIIIIMFTALPNIRAFFNSEVIQDVYTFKIDISTICIILSAIQIVFTLSNISITGVSRDGKNAKMMKILPIDLYKQFLYKNIPQVVINFIVTIIILIFVKLLIQIITYWDLFMILLITILINILNSELMLLIDFIRPNLNWDSEYEVIKQNNNKLFQYVLSILIILLFTYFSKIFDEINLNISYIIIITLLISINIIINLIIKKYISKIFEKIN